MAAVEDDGRGRLRGPASFLGAPGGYFGADLTSLQVAYRRGEVDRPRGDEALELRVHGVGGTSAAQNLETPHTLLVAGDGRAGFHRPWRPGGRPADGAAGDADAAPPAREAYCWGRFSTAGLTSALWLLLLPFALVNMATFALPAPEATRPRAFNRRLRRASRMVLRLLALTLTVAFTATACYLTVDVVAREAAGQQALPSWLAWFQHWSPTLRHAAALSLALAVVAALRVFSHLTAGRYECWSAGTGIPDERPDGDLMLGDKFLWQGSASVRRQQLAHVAAACAVVVVYAGLAFEDGSAVTTLAWMVAGAMVAVAVAVLVLPGTDRLWGRTGNAEGGGRLPPWRLGEALSWAIAVAAVVVVLVAGPRRSSPGYEVEGWLLIGAVLAEYALLALLVVLLSWQRPGAERDVMAHGFTAALFAGVAVAVSSVFGGALLLTVTNVLADPSPQAAAGSGEIYVPSIVYAGNLAFVMAVVAMLGVGGVLLLRRRTVARRTLAGTAEALGVLAAYDVLVPGAASGTHRDDVHAAAAKRVAGVWATSRLIDHIATAFAWVCWPTLAVLGPVALVRQLDVADDAGVVGDVAQVGGTVAIAAVVGFAGLLRSALLDEAGRRRFAFFWDIVNFWPRAAHPFAPPCYTERVVPELITRVRRVVGDARADDEVDPAAAQVDSEMLRHDPDTAWEEPRPVLLNGYSQGAPISIAVVAQLPAGARPDVALLTLACPARRLYGRAFPLYFGPRELGLLADLLTDDTGRTRWLNAVRASDYVGGEVRVPGVDRWILDPPALWATADPSPPPAHRHSHWFADPQTRPFAVELTARLRAPASASEDRDPTLAPR